MTQRTEAILILRQARDVLLARLTERVLEAKEEILDDAEGGLFQGGIDEIYEQLVTRLSHINAMLNLLPADEPVGSVDTHPLSSGDGQDGLAAATVMDTNDVSFGGRAETPALPAPHTGAALAAGTDIVPVEITPLESPPPGGASFRSFGTQVFTGDLDAAGESLAELFHIDPARGRRCAEAFAEQLAHSPDVMTKAMSLRKEIAAGNFNASLMLLYECFALQGMEAIRVLQTLMGRLGSE
ncbi:MAG: hypothetical protein DCC68_06325 [Planctomycetota bacterium]|nr:MAG: hypothetical protein DCC68_06325 [Planctomycetota bacterium]